MISVFGKTLFLCACLLFVFAARNFSQTTALQADVNPQRIIYSINDNWRFFGDDVKDAEKFGLADDAWERVNIPHTWNAKDAFDDSPGYRRGAGWYRKNLQLSSSLKDRRIFLYFEGANQVADVFVNEKLVGHHIGGYTAFSFDITDFVKFGAPNLLAVKVNNSFNTDIPPLTADFTFYGGIYRNTWLIATADVHIKTTDYASSGIQISTPNLTEKSGTVSVRGSVVNSGKSERNVEIINSLLDAQGKEISSFSTKQKIAPAGEAIFEQTSKPIETPKLWSPDNPYLYTVKTTIRENGKTLDEISNPLGFRWYSFDAEKGFSLNGRPLRLRGVNRHQDYAGMGNAVPDSIQVHDMEIIKNAGFNFVRLAHYPQTPAVLQAADRLGILIWEEVPLVNYITISQGFNENSATMLREMIRQHRNHPAVILWGYMNEIFLRVPKENEANIKKATVALAKDLNQIAKTEDPTRLTTIAFHASDSYNTEGLGDVPDIIGWNVYNGWYSKAFEDFGPFIDDQHKRFPKRPLIISEYGANSDLRLHSLNPRRFDSTAEYQRMFHESYLRQLSARPFIAGSALWSEFDFGSEYRGEDMPNVNNKGLYTFDRQPKDVYYFYKANLSTEPVLHVAAKDWQYRAGTDLSPQKIDVYSNLEEVELFCNGISLGKKKPDEFHKATWDVTFRDGKNLLTATGLKNNLAQTDSIEISYQLINVNSDQIAVNVGSNAQFIDQGKTVWIADQPYTKGGFGYIGTEAKAIYSASTDKNVLGTSDDPVFQTMQEGLTAYRLDVPAGEYEVELRFAETKFEKTGERVFDVAINGQTMVEKLDLVKEIGFQRGLTRTFKVSVNDGITIGFTPITGKPVLSGVKLKKL